MSKNSEYSVSVATDEAGTPYIAGFGLVDQFVIESETQEGKIETVSPFYVSGGCVYVAKLIAGSILANKIMPGTIQTSELELSPGDGQGLTVYKAPGEKIPDRAVSVFPRRAMR